MNEENEVVGGEAVENPETNINTDKKTKDKNKTKWCWLLLGLFAGVALSQIVVLVMLKVNGRDTLFLQNGLLDRKKDTILSNDVKEKIDLLENSIDQFYISEVSDEELVDGIYEGLVDATGDRYADYYTKDDMEKLREKTTGVFYGIGAYVGVDTSTNYPKLTGIFEDSPAEKAGLKAEDIIVEIDGKNVNGMELEEVVSYIKGPQGTQVVLTIYRNGETEYRDITVTRDKVESITVSYQLLEDNIAYIRIHQFESVTSNQFAEKLKQARDDQMKGLIIDLRSNPGGTLESVIEVARQMLPEGMIVYTEDKYGKKNEFKCNGAKQLEVPLVILVNEGSASAAEILAGAVKDHGIGKLVGKTTFGKGIVQKVFYISDGTAVKLTISHYYTPNGNDIHEVGIKPDVEVDLDPDKYYDEEVDTQLEKAKEVLLKLMHG
ncbi:MAG: S41 family peptidase [Lachnospiraceae bacterium]|nr:S41 family peptidase [Lachnospiraceae bacterium]